jgi:hypothetical protein
MRLLSEEITKHGLATGQAAAWDVLRGVAALRQCTPHYRLLVRPGPRCPCPLAAGLACGALGLDGRDNGAVLPRGGGLSQALSLKTKRALALLGRTLQALTVSNIRIRAVDLEKIKRRTAGP